MSEPALPLQAAIFAALRASAALKTICGDPVRVYDTVPPAAVGATPREPTFPYLTIGDDQILDDSTSCEEAFECFVTVHGWSRARGKPELKRAMAAVRDALNVTLTVDGFVVVVAEHRDTRYSRDPDGITEHAVASFRYLIDPA
jgi:hypothetical protein